MPRYVIQHRTSYIYGSSVIQSNHLLHLAPRPVSHQRVLSHGLEFDPLPAWRSDRVDYFGNPITLISLEDEHRSFEVTARSEIDVTVVSPPAFKDTTPWERIAAGRVPMAPSIVQYVCASPFCPVKPELRAFARSVIDDDMPVLEGAQRLMQHIYEEFEFDNATTDIATPVKKVLEQKSGVCQDFAHLQISALRSLGVPARYVSGYILTHPPEGKEKLEGSDASHAWVAVWAPETGWVEFDPTNDLVNSPEHIAIAYGRDFADVSPISGVLLGGGRHSVGVAVDVRPIEAANTDAPRSERDASAG